MAKKLKTKTKLEPIAKRYFDSNRNLDEVHVCANGQGWTDKATAEKYAEKLDDDNVYTFKRADFEITKQPIKVADMERDTLLARYELLAGKAAPSNIKDETLKAKVDELEQQLKTV
jgi:hypothetical protein